MSAPSVQQPEKNKVITILHATYRPNAKGEYNWLEWKEVPKINLKVLQEHVKGNIALVPYVGSKKQPFECYMNENGLLKEEYGRNDLAGGALYVLGFRGGEALGCAYAGNVVITGHKHQGLTSKQQNALLYAIEIFREDSDDAE